MSGECPICFDACRDSVVCPCPGAHAFCRQCLQGIRILQCPVCRDSSAHVAQWLFHLQMDPAIVEETFFAWEEGKRMAFRFERSTLPVSAAVEDYVVVETPEGCELRWAGKASAPLILGGIVSKQLAKGLRDGMPKLEALIRDNPARFGL